MFTERKSYQTTTMRLNEPKAIEEREWYCPGMCDLAEKGIMVQVQFQEHTTQFLGIKLQFRGESRGDNTCLFLLMILLAAICVWNGRQPLSTPRSQRPGNAHKDKFLLDTLLGCGSLSLYFLDDNGPAFIA